MGTVIGPDFGDSGVMVTSKTSDLASILAGVNVMKDSEMIGAGNGEHGDMMSIFCAFLFSLYTIMCQKLFAFATVVSR